MNWNRIRKALNLETAVGVAPHPELVTSSRQIADLMFARTVNKEYDYSQSRDHKGKVE